MKQSQKSFKKIVLKIGSSLLCSEDSSIDRKRVFDIADQVSDLIKNEDKEVVIVSSGAVAFGMSVLGLKSRPKELSYLQAVASIGQHELMNVYGRSFKERHLNCGQVLLTWEDFDDRRRFLNARNTLLTLLKIKCVPIINENDTVSTDEIKFGDNDRLSALVSMLIGADLLIILSDVDGLMDSQKKVIQVVDDISPRVKELAAPSSRQTCVGGMITKIEAAKIAVDSGIPCVIANGKRKNIILSVLGQPQNYGTLFLPKKGLNAWKHWIAFGTKPKGKIIVDDGAKQALVNKKSLLAVGVVGVEGNFDSGDIVMVSNKQGQEFGRGKAGISSKQLDKIMGGRFDKEIIHRDNMVIL